MLRFDINPHIKEKILMLRILKKDISTCTLLNSNTEENNIAIIYDDNAICGGALILGSRKPEYIFCFFNNSRYSDEKYYQELNSLISETFPEAIFFDIYCYGKKFFEELT